MSRRTESEHTPTLGGARDRPLALAFVDIDAFEMVNDTRGHAIGDAPLKDTADRLEQIASDEQVATRLGGDEFMLLFPAAAPETVTSTPGSVRERLQQPLRLPSGLVRKPRIGIGAA